MKYRWCHDIVEQRSVLDSSPPRMTVATGYKISLPATDASSVSGIRANEPADRTYGAFISGGQRSKVTQMSQVQRKISRERPLWCKGLSAREKVITVAVAGNKVANRLRNCGLETNWAGCGAGLLGCSATKRLTSRCW